MAIASRPKPLPATTGTVFGGLWAFIAAMATPAEWRLAAALLVGLVTVLLVARLWWSRPAIAPSGERLFGKGAYRLAVILEVAAIYAASALLPRLGWQDYFIQAVGIIVGLHFIGLWWATRAFRFVGIAAGMSLLSALAILLPGAVHGLHLRDAATGIANALVLWIGAGRTMRREA